MDKQERANRRAKDAIIALLVASEQPKNEDEAVASMNEWEALTYDKLLEALDYNLKHNAYRNAVLENHVNRCIREADRVKTQKQLAGAGT